MRWRPAASRSRMAWPSRPTSPAWASRGATTSSTAERGRASWFSKSLQEGHHHDSPAGRQDGLSHFGRATALAFAREGARVIATDIDSAGLDALARECACTVRRLDCTDGDAIAAAAREVGPVQVLFNAAGVVHAGTVLDY